MPRILNSIATLAVATVVPALVPDSVEAGEEITMEEIVVTATKREVLLSNLPLSVGVVTGEELSATGATNLDDYWRAIPSLNVRDGPFGGSSVIIRGLSDADGFQQNESLTAFYLDDTAITYVEGLFATPGDPMLIDVERVEVLRGPQGTLIGANSMGGAIRVITHEPDPEKIVRRVETGVSSTAHGGINYGGNAILNQPLPGSSAAFRLSAFYRDEDGFIDDVGTHKKNINSDRQVGVRTAVLWNLTEEIDVLARYYYESRKLGGYRYRDPVGKPELGLATGDYGVALLSREPRDEETHLAAVRLRWRNDRVEFYSATSWYKKTIFLNYDWSPEFHDLFGFYNAAPFSSDLRQEDISQELRLSSSGTGNLKWLIGFYYLNQDSHDIAHGAAPGIHGACPGCFPFIGADEVLLSSTDLRTREETAVFGEINWRFMADVELTLGGRWYNINRSLESSGFFGFLPIDESIEGGGSDFIPKLSLSWDVSDHTMIYGLVSKGYRAGLFNDAAARVSCGARDVLDSDELWNYELGMHTRLVGGRLSLNAVAFHIDWSDMQTSAFDPVRCDFAVKDNAGKAISEGVEIDFTAEIDENLRLQGGFGYNDARLAKANAAFNAPKGRRIPNVPRVTANLAATWLFKWRGEIDGFVRGDMQYVGSRTTLFDPTLPQIFPTLAELDDYTLFNVRIGAELRQWRTELYVENLFDKAADLFCCRYQFDTAINRPRTIGGRVIFNFR